MDKLSSNFKSKKDHPEGWFKKSIADIGAKGKLLLALLDFFYFGVALLFEFGLR